MESVWPPPLDNTQQCSTFVEQCIVKSRERLAETVGSKPEKVMNIGAQQKVRYSYQKVQLVLKAADVNRQNHICNSVQ